MFRITMKFHIFLVFAFFIGMEVEANPMERCLGSFNMNELQSLAHLSKEDQLKFLCTNMTSFLGCINDVFRQETGYTMREVAGLLQGTEVGKALQLMVNIGDLVEEICTEGSELREGYLRHAHCFGDSDHDVGIRCQTEAKDAYQTFNNVATDYFNDKDEACLVAAYQFGCLGAAVKEECGDDAYEYFKKVVKKVGLFKSGVCSSNIMQTIKTTFLDSLNISDSHKAIYRVIVELKRRRK